ncbi:MAG: 5'-nucleotidase [Promethearchaeota archaeon CR_4]|nr:MAG: 5'-nucleotidase [Candidatus Lokiarchaeota archaeon CR_4]
MIHTRNMGEVALFFILIGALLSSFSAIVREGSIMGVSSLMLGSEPSTSPSPTWGANGTLICNATDSQERVQVVSDLAGGVILVWQDTRGGSTADIYAQRIDSAGSALWGANGTVICNEANDQYYPQIATDEVGGAIITWQDNRSGNWDVSAQRMINLAPVANTPTDITTAINDTETIGWVLIDDQGSGQYRVRVTNASGDIVWVDWTTWANNVTLNVPIARVTAGTFNYILEYTDDQGMAGISDTVVVTITSPEGGWIPGFPATVLLMVAGFATILLTRRVRRILPA